MSGECYNFVLENFKEFCRNLNIEQVVSSSHHHQSINQVEGHIKFIEQTLKKSFETKNDLYLTLLNTRSSQLGPGLPCPVTLLFNHSIRGIMLVINRSPINSNNEDDYNQTNGKDKKG